MKYLFIVLFCTVSLLLSGETMIIHLASGATAEYQVQNVQQITFSNVSNEDWANFLPRIPIRFLKNYPNPFNPQTKILFELAEKGRTEVSIFNIKGQLLRKLADETMNKGTHEIVWDGKDEKGVSCASGTYVYKVKSNNQIKANKMIILK